MESCIRADNTTVVICCAGMGTRLGIGTTKALIDICGKPLIIRQLELLEACDDVRIVVGFDAEKLIKIVKNYRKDIMFVFNYEYMDNGPADSLKKALLGARDFIITIDGDTICNTYDFIDFLAVDDECIAITRGASKEAIEAKVIEGKVVSLSMNSDEKGYQWSGISKIRKEKLVGDFRHTYEILNTQLPMRVFNMRLKEINIQEDYEQAIEWFCSNMEKKVELL